MISPDHFSTNQSQIITSSRNWNLSTGVARYSNILNLNLPQNDQLLIEDHGIYNPLTDLRKFFPLADFEPILIGQQVTANQLQSLLSNIQKHCHLDCLLVASVDFSHYLPATLAEVHDAYTLKNLHNLDRENILKSEVDSPQSLYVLTFFSSLKSAFRWHLFEHTNSGIITQNPDIETTTHIFGSYSRGPRINSDTLAVVYLPQLIDRQSSQKTLGDRFFYGVDEFTVDSSHPNFVIGQITFGHKTIKNFLPISNNKFIVGPEKQLLIKKYFDTINDSTITKDYFWGTLTYERKN